MEAEDRARNRLVLALVPGVFLAGFAGGIAFPILPIVGVRAGLSLPFIGVILAANRAGRVVSNPFIGALTDRVGGRRILILGLTLQVAVMALYTLGVTTGRPGSYFLAGRLLHGLGSACVFVSAQVLALQAGGASHGGRAAGTVRAAMGVGVPAGLVAGGILSDRWGAAATFEGALFVMVAATIAALVLVPDGKVRARRMATLRQTLGALADRPLAAVGILNFAMYFSAQGMVLTTLVLLVRARAIALPPFHDEGTAGVLMGWMVIVDAGVMLVAGRLGDRYRVHERIAAGGLVMLIPALLVTGLSRTVPGLLIGMTLVGLGSGALGPSLVAMVGRLVPPERQGIGVGLLSFCGDFGGMLGPLVGTALLVGSIEEPYLLTAAVVACFLPVAIWLVRVGARLPSRG